MTKTSQKCFGCLLKMKWVPSFARRKKEGGGHKVPAAGYYICKNEECEKFGKKVEEAG